MEPFAALVADLVGAAAPVIVLGALYLWTVIGSVLRIARVVRRARAAELRYRERLAIHRASEGAAAAAAP